MKNIDTLVKDIYEVINEGTEVHEEDMQFFLDFIRDETTRFFSKEERSRGRKPSIRMSNIGKEARKMWYDFYEPIDRDLKPNERIKFFYGHMLEAFLLFLCKVANHDVRDMQREVELNGIKGHIDAVVDGVVTDAKSSSSYGFRKFDRGELFTNDPFGYVYQISGYMQAMDMDRGAFLAIDKQYGDLALLPIEEMDTLDASKRIDELRDILANKKEPPERCYDDEIEDNGNRSLGSECRWCNHKYNCWSDSNKGEGLRTFNYSRGYRYFTHVAREPRVEEIL